MTWKELLAQKRVERVPAGEGEIEGLLTLSARALADALIIAMTPEGRYDRAYDAARTLATAVVRSCGYRVKAVGGGHYNTFRALEAADAKQFGAYAIYLDVCRRKRNELSYESFGFVSDTELEELIEQTSKFRNLTMAWMRSRK